MNEAEAVRLFKCLSDKSRLQILKSLAIEDMYVERLAERLNLTAPTVSFHLKKLADAGAVTCYKSQYYTMYALNRSVFEIRILDTLQEMLPEGDPRKALVSEDLITYVEDRKGHDRRYAIAPDKIKAEVGWYPETCFEEGIRKTIAWFFENEEWMKNVTSGDYQKYYEDMYSNK